MKAIILILFLIVSLSAGAYVPKEGNVHAVIGSYSSQTNYRNSQNKPSPVPIFSGFSLMAQGDASDKGNLEICINYFNKLYFREDGGNYLSERIQYLQITMGYRYWLNNYWSTALAFASGYPLATPQTATSYLPNDSTFETSAHDPSEAGLDMSLAYDVWNQEPYSIVVDLRYTYSFTSRSGESADNMGAIVGLRYLIQEKQVKNKK
ncbi:MAG: hypothetical protein AABY64_00185 [Bdellovibrionota bacterium]